MKEWVNAEVVKFHWNGVMVAWYRYVFCLSCGSWPSLCADKVTEYIQNYICCCGGVKWPRAVFSSLDFCCMMLRISTVYAVTQCVHLSVTFICAVKLSKRSIKIFSPSVIHTILVFFISNVAIFRHGLRQKLWFLTNIWLCWTVAFRQHSDSGV